MSFQEIKDYIYIIDQVVGNTPKQTEQVVVEDLTCKVNQISEDIENLQKTLSDIKSSLDMPELKGETFTMQGKLEFIGKQSRTLEEVYTKVTRMTGQACACDKFVRRQFYDFTFCNLKAVHDDLNARVADLKSADTNLTKEENEKLQILLADQRGREKQVEQLEATRAQLFLSVCKITCMLDVVFVSLFVCFWLKAILSPYHVKFFWCGYGQKYPSYFKRTCRILLACVMREAQNVFVSYPTL